MLRTLSVFALLIVLTSAEVDKWDSFKLQFGRSYSHQSIELKRYDIFKENLQTIEAHNKKYEQGLISYKMGVNKFTDLSKEEFISLMGLKGIRKNITRKVKFELSADVVVPKQINWVHLGAVTEVKDQGSCGSCWSFSTTGAIEGQYYLKKGRLISLSEQNLIDCASDYGEDGCNGGWMDDAFEYVSDNGIMSESDYPYLEKDGNMCNFDAQKSIIKVKSIVDIQSRSEENLKEAVGIVGPVSVAVDATEFQHYVLGLFDNKDCLDGKEGLNHAVLAVGYGTTRDGKDYWLVKNSWGTDWGENGYIKMSRNSNNQCGIATVASYPVL